MKIVLLIRRDKDYWLNNRMTYNGALTPFFGKSIKVKSFGWNLLFRMKYLDFRKRLSYISSFSYSPNKFDDIIPYLDRDRINNLEPGTLIVPMDDDDWFSPDLVKNLRKIKDPGRGICWDQYVKYSDGNIKHQNRHIGKRINEIDSCCYGIKCPCEYDHLRFHWEMTKDNMLYMPERLSIKIEAISCISVLIKIQMNNSIILAKYCEWLIRELKKDIGSSDIFPEEYSNQGRLYKELLKELLESQNKAVWCSG